MDWHKFTKKLLLDDGRIGEREAELIKRAILADRKVDREEIEFLVDLKRSSASVHPEFDRFLFEILRRAVLLNGVVSDTEARWMRQLLFADRRITAAEVQFLTELKKEAKSTGPEFEQLYKECLAAQAPPARRT